MDVYGLSSPDLFRIDDLLDFSNDVDFFPSSTSSAAATTSSSSSFPPENSFNHHFPSSASSFLHPSSSFLADFTQDLSFPSDDAAQLEWLSQFVDDSFSDVPAANLLGGTMNIRSDMSFPGKPRSKRSRAPPATGGIWNIPMTESEGHASGKAMTKKEGGGRQQSSAAAVEVPAEGDVRRCTHCASEKTPQWRSGPLGPKTLCNACGVRYKSGRLVPEYRPAASPTFVLTQHSNSHRKVVELRRQKELMKQQQPPSASATAVSAAVVEELL